MTLALRAELTKLRSVRSTTWSLLAIVGLTIALGVVSSSTSSTEGGSPDQPGDENVVMMSLAGVYFAQIAVVALGVLAVCSEYATGTIRATFAANPRRRQVLTAKVAIVGALVSGASAVATVVAFYLGQALLHDNGFTYDNGYPAASLADGETLRTVGIAAAYLVVLAVLSLAAAAILRDTAAAICVLLGLLFVPWIVGGLLPEDLGHALEKATPMVGLAAQERGAPISPWGGIAVTVAWAAVALVVALWLVRRRDA
jgi:ABC-2 type transport system permease protein